MEPTGSDKILFRGLSRHNPVSQSMQSEFPLVRQVRHSFSYPPGGHSQGWPLPASLTPLRSLTF